MLQKKTLLVFAIAMLIVMDATAHVADVCTGDVGKRLFNDSWTFRLEDKSGRVSAAEAVVLPHDWAVKGEFSADNPSGTGGGALPGGIGWYEKTFYVDKSDKGKAFRLTFDGAYMNTTVWVNGKELGTRPYGYISFTYDITKHLRYGRQNTVRVKVDNSDQPNSRWYSGCGIYRNVWLTKTNAVHVAQDGTFVTVADITDSQATVNVAVDIVNNKNVPVRIDNVVFDAEGREVARGTDRMTVKSPKRWSVETPYLYSVMTRVYDEAGELLDEYITRFGIRTFEFTSEGFFLNGKRMQIQGVCNHHDLGCLGAAVNRRAMQRQLEMLKSAGINGIRVAHNPPAPELLDLCDEMGFIVMNETFDMWRKRKTANDYAKYFDEWHERDLSDMVRRDRNHPSVFMWCIGNEVLEQWTHADADTLSLAEANLILNFGHDINDKGEMGNDKAKLRQQEQRTSDEVRTQIVPSGARTARAGNGELSVNSLLARKLAGIVKTLDSTRPITAGCNEPSPKNHLFRSGALDIIGYNYHNQNIPDVPKNFPGMPFIITESNSALMTRGYYRQNSDSAYVWPERWDKPFYDRTFSCSSYENCHVPWGSTNEETLLLMKKYPWICGQYVWTGFDYIGEPTPYGWPARSSYFGMIDLAGFPKDVYYLYKSELTDEDVLHVFPHWNFGSETHAGEGIEPSVTSADGMVDVWAYYNNADEVELFLNGRSQGIRSKNDSLLHCVWRVKYEPGQLLAVARKDGRIVNSKTIRTAGKPAQIRLTPDRSVIAADGTDLSYITVEILDKDGNLCPNASNLVMFEVAGNARIAGVDNGSPISMERFSDNKRRAFYGKCMLVVQNDGTQGMAKIVATADGLTPATVTITTMEGLRD